MNDNAKKWVEALRSGRFKQGRGALTKVNPKTGEERDCCLGVACKLFIEDGGVLNIGLIDGSAKRSYNGNTGNLPAPVRNWLGLMDVGGIIDSEDMNLAEKNDNGASFKQIADIIEKYEKELFK